jgi:hypothetical protein
VAPILFDGQEDEGKAQFKELKDRITMRIRYVYNYDLVLIRASC